jgi:hypothetical protein
MGHPLRCACGELSGHVVPARASRRAVCYCRDCRAYARHLGRDDVLDARGGTDVVAMHPREIHLTRMESLACLSLRQGGLLRWFAACCNTPIANTPRDPRVAYAGVVHTCLEQGSPSIDASFGTAAVAVNVKSALGSVAASPFATMAAVLHLGTAIAAARLSGSYRDNPFFRDGLPACPGIVLTAAERERAYRDR